jgi:hypothetical protein
MAKGQKKSNKETRKPKTAGSKAAKATPSSFIATAAGKTPGRPK